MKRKFYISPEFEWMAVELFEDVLTGSDPDNNEDSDDNEDDLLDGDGEDPIPEVTTPDWDW